MKTAVITFGRFNPPTIGHQKLIDYLHKQEGDHFIIVSHSQDTKKNPLSIEDKIKYLKKANPNANIIAASKEAPSIFHHAANLNKQGYDHLHVVVGADRVKEFEQSLNRYNGTFKNGLGYNFKKITVSSAGDRTNSDDVSGMSASKARAIAKTGNVEKFKKALHPNLHSHAKEIMDKINKQLKEISENFGLSLTESAVSKLAKQMGLEYAGFNYYRNKATGKITHKNVNGKLIPISKLNINDNNFYSSDESNKENIQRSFDASQQTINPQSSFNDQSDDITTKQNPVDMDPVFTKFIENKNVEPLSRQVIFDIGDAVHSTYLKFYEITKNKIGSDGQAYLHAKIQTIDPDEDVKAKFNQLAQALSEIPGVEDIKFHQKSPTSSLPGLTYTYKGIKNCSIVFAKGTNGNKGEAFEKFFLNQCMQYAENMPVSEMVKDLFEEQFGITPDKIDKIYKHSDSTKRGYSETTIDLSKSGKTISDVTIELKNGDVKYLSVKNENGDTFANFGIVKHFDYENLVFNGRLGFALQGMGLDTNLMAKGYKARIEGEEFEGPDVDLDLTVSSNEAIDLLKQMLGNNYTYVRQYKDGIETFDMNDRSVELLTKDLKVTKISYPGSNRKQVTITLSNKYVTYKLEVRDTKGKDLPTQLNGKFYKLNYEQLRTDSKMNNTVATIKEMILRKMDMLIEASEHNSAFGHAYELSTILYIHNNTAAKNNRNKEYQNEIENLKTQHEEALSKLPPNLAEKAKKTGEASGAAYLESLKNQGIHPKHVYEVHHTFKGISHLVGHTVSQSDAPHDLVVKYKNESGHGMHGASLKATPGTASNNTPNLVPGLKDHYDKAAQKAGLYGKTKAQRKEITSSNKDEYKKKGQEAQLGAAKIHEKYFNSLSIDDQRSHLYKLMRHNTTNPIPLDYTKGNKSTPYHELPHIKAVGMATHFSTKLAGNRVKIYAHGPNGEKVKF